MNEFYEMKSNISDAISGAWYAVTDWCDLHIDHHVIAGAAILGTYAFAIVAWKFDLAG